jgi:predicted transcriptional regulator
MKRLFNTPPSIWVETAKLIKSREPISHEDLISGLDMDTSRLDEVINHYIKKGLIHCIDGKYTVTDYGRQKVG